MKKIIFIFVVIVVIAGFFLIRIFKNPVKTSPSSIPPQFSPISNPTGLADPIAKFKARITKKPFGIYITPQNSPVQPERFTGYHTGVDVEYSDISADVPVFALADGTITYSNWVSGYGGVLIIKTDIGGIPHSVLYGHLRPSSLPAVGTQFKKSGQMAVLGTGYSQETDSERRHLHFAILSNDRIDLKSYVQNKSDLSGWLDPLTFY